MGEDVAKFAIGQRICHQRFDYRGVVVDVDPVYQGTDEWYEQVAGTRPPKDKPWYRVLVHGHGHETYVAERNLAPDDSSEPIEHPLLGIYFSGFQDGIYVPAQRSN
ncbi:MAG: heat shock protein HspQ [Gammaproteobacteria bacterium]